MDTVDSSAPDSHACGFAAVAFVPGRTMGQKTVGGRLLAIVEIKVIAGLNSSGWHSTGNATQYAIMRAPGVEI
jgi:hypothetical protein